MLHTHSLSLSRVVRLSIVWRLGRCGRPIELPRPKRQPRENSSSTPPAMAALPLYFFTLLAAAGASWGEKCIMAIRARLSNDG